MVSGFLKPVSGVLATNTFILLWWAVLFIVYLNTVNLFNVIDYIKALTYNICFYSLYNILLQKFSSNNFFLTIDC